MTQKKLEVRRLFGFLVLLSLIPTGIGLNNWGYVLASANPGLFVLKYMWILVLLMAFTVSVWIRQGCQNIKEGYVLYYVFVLVSIIFCHMFGESWRGAGKLLTYYLLGGSFAYMMLIYVERGHMEIIQLPFEWFTQKYILTTTVLMTFATSYAIASLLPIVGGLVLAVIVPAIVTMVAVSVWKDSKSNGGVALVIGAFFAGMVSLFYFGLWPVVIFVFVPLLIMWLVDQKPAEVKE